MHYTPYSMGQIQRLKRKGYRIKISRAKREKTFPSPSGTVKCVSSLPSKKEKMAHLTPRQKYAIQVLRGEKCSQKEIAQKIGKDKTVISRELRRSNTPESGTFFTYSKSLPDTDNYTRFLDYKMPFLSL